MANIVVTENITTNAVECACGEDECYFCEPFAGMTDEEAMDLFYSCPKCHALASEEHDEECAIGQIVARWNEE
jgi:DNA-directed RNA polymerase subunit M/transcription elongation factor TFIIS